MIYKANVTVHSKHKLAWSVTGVIRRWIFGAFLRCLVLPSFKGRGRFTTYCRTSSSFPKLNNFLILDARFGPRRRGTVLSVKPGISYNYKQTFEKWNWHAHVVWKTLKYTDHVFWPPQHTPVIYYKILHNVFYACYWTPRQTPHRTN